VESCEIICGIKPIKARDTLRKVDLVLAKNARNAAVHQNTRFWSKSIPPGPGINESLILQTDDITGESISLN
jgi:hypothetical protein